MHSGMRGGPHVGALRRCSFTDTEIKLQCSSTSISRNATCWFSGQQVRKVAWFPSRLQLLPACLGTRLTKLHTITDGHGCSEPEVFSVQFSGKRPKAYHASLKRCLNSCKFGNSRRRSFPSLSFLKSVFIRDGMKFGEVRPEARR